MNASPLTGTIFQSLTDHYELIVYGNILFLVGCVALYYLAKLKMISGEKKLSWTLGAGLAVLQLTGIAAMVYIQVDNLEEKVAMDRGLDISVSTDWVKDDLEIYFIKENLIQTVPVRGGEPKVLYRAGSPVREYHFSPDGKNLLIVSQKALVVMDRRDKKVREIARLPDPAPDGKTAGRGVIQGVQWAPDSRRFCYRIVSWSPHYYKDAWMIDDLKNGTKTRINTVGYRLASLKWDRKGEKLYYLWFEALDTSRFVNPFEVKVIEVSPEGLRPKEVMRFFYDKPTIPPSHLALRDIYLFESGQLSFTRQKRPREVAVSPVTGARVGIDRDDYMYYIKNRWWKRRLYYVPRVPKTRRAYPDFKPGDLAVQNPRWLPSGRYVIMEHYLFGIIVLDPGTGRLGILVNDECRGIGWPPEALSKRRR